MRGADYIRVEERRAELRHDVLKCRADSRAVVSSFFFSFLLFAVELKIDGNLVALRSRLNRCALFFKLSKSMTFASKGPSIN